MRKNLRCSKYTSWNGEVPELSVYDWRGCRMLDKKCWKGKCFTCIWAAMSNVTIEYNWGVSQKFRFENGVWMYEHGVLEQIKDDIKETMSQSVPVTENLIKNTLLQRFISAVVKAVSPML